MTADREPEIAAVTACPFCRSTNVTTASKALTESTYWRCTACGEIWNPSRAHARRSANSWRS
jgi:transposase-like protein